MGEWKRGGTQRLASLSRKRSVVFIWAGLHWDSKLGYHLGIWVSHMAQTKIEPVNRRVSS